MPDDSAGPHTPSPPYFVAAYKGRTAAIKRDSSYELRSADPQSICVSTTLPEYGDTLVQIGEEMWPDVVGLIKTAEVTLEELSDDDHSSMDAKTRGVAMDSKEPGQHEQSLPATPMSSITTTYEVEEKEKSDSLEGRDEPKSDTGSRADGSLMRRPYKPVPILPLRLRQRKSSIDSSQQNNASITSPALSISSPTGDSLNLGTGAHPHKTASPSLPKVASPTDDTLNLGTGGRLQITPTRPLRKLVKGKVNASLPIVLNLRPPTDEVRISVSIDFGTTGTGVAYGSSQIAGGRVQLLQQWPGAYENLRKVPTCLLYNGQGQVLEWGQNAKPGKRPVDVIADFLSRLWDYAKQQIQSKVGTAANLELADICITVPATWDAKACDIMRKAAIQAGIAQGHTAPKGNNKLQKDRLRIISECEAAAVYCAQLTSLHQLHVSQKLMICDAGGSTTNFATYRILGSPTQLEIGGVCARGGADWGGYSFEARFRDAVAELLESFSEPTEVANLSYFQTQFARTAQMEFKGEEDDTKLFEFKYLFSRGADKPSIGLADGSLKISGAVLRTKVFDPVIEQLLDLIEAQLAQCAETVDALMLVGGCSHNEYLVKRVSERFRSRIGVISRPVDIDTATCRGAARCGLSQYAFVSCVIAPCAYMVRANLRAEPEDQQKRPQYINRGSKGFDLCDNRLHYIVEKGGTLRRGKKIVKGFRKFSKGVEDSMFVGVLYTSDSNDVKRYTDEDGVHELCRLRVDLSALPNFGENTKMGDQTGFYTSFKIAFELDTAELRGVLLHNGDDWSPITFDFRSTTRLI
ncbi:hypothetical protein FRC07_000233 [Ceratobasidium sp. 392]|nr:hypothetical protein FRC07_000233 [Ceratobasidium sp. 392]